jgi:hypothetical protein
LFKTFYEQLRGYTGGILVSELGCGGFTDFDAVVAGFAGREHLLEARDQQAFRESLSAGFTARGLGPVFGSVLGFIRAAQDQQARGNTRQIEAVLGNPRVSGYTLTQLNDVAWETQCGVLDVWRNPKPAYEALKRLNRPYCLILKAAAPVAACAQPVTVAVTLVAEQPVPEGAWLAVTVSGPGETRFEARLLVPGTSERFIELPPVVMAGAAEPGTLTLTAALHGPAGVLAESTETVLVLAPAPAVDGLVEWIGEPPAGQAPGTAAGPILVAAQPGALSADQWQRFLDAVEAGRTGLVGALRPADAVALQALAGRGLPVALHTVYGSWSGAYHWLSASPVFAGLPGGLAGEAYAGVVPAYGLVELGGESLAGCLHNGYYPPERMVMIWYSEIEIVRLGQGTLGLCQYRCFEHAASNPLAARLAANLVHTLLERMPALPGRAGPPEPAAAH